MRKRHRFLSALLCVVTLSTMAVPVGASQSKARLYNVYGNHMLFQQKEDAIFAGVASPNAVIVVKLKNAAGKTVRSACANAEKNGAFSVSFSAPEGSFEVYSVVLSANGKKLAALEDVVFGELWLSFGQSNMEYMLSQTPEGRQMQAQGKTGSSGIRVLSLPHKTKDGAFYADAVPQTDVPGCFWYSADDPAVYNMSAVAYFFAEKILDKLNMPVGILNAAVGGSAIAAWLPGQAIEADSDVLQAVKAHGAYVSPETWNSGNRNYICDMTGLYNTKIAPLLHFRPAGGIWYQGETDLMFYNDPVYYGQLFNLMQDSYTALFSQKQGRLLIVFTQLVTFNYGLGPYGETRFNDAFTALAAEDPASRGEVVVHDILPEYDADNHPIHPNNKKPVGERMAQCALSLVYGGAAPTSSPFVTDMRARGGSVYVTFSHVGDGLVCRDSALRGFSVYGEDGVCVGAQAEIVSADTVRVFSNEAPAPKGAAYAVNSVSLSANLYSSFAGECYLPAASFGSGDSEIIKLFDDAAWLSCDTLSAWQNGADATGLHDTWTGHAASLSVSDDCVQGNGSLEIRGKGVCFSASAVLGEKKGLQRVPFDSVDGDFTNYGTLSVRLKNTGAWDVTLREIRLSGATELFFSPLCNESGKNSVVLPADGLWHAYSFDLNALGLLGGSTDRWSNEALDSVCEVRLCFAGRNAKILCDSFRFSPEGKNDDARTSFLQRVVFFFAQQFEKVRSFFAGLFQR